MPDGTLPEIEKKVARDRDALEASLASLSDTLDPDRLRNDLSQLVDRYGTELGGQAWNAARGNPAAFALVGAGLAMLLSGTGRRGENTRQGTAYHHDTADLHDDGADSTIAEANASLREETGADFERPNSHRLRAALHDGLHRLSPEARARVLNARHSALRAQQNIELRAAQTRQKADRIVRERPIATGAAAFGIGALIAAVLPSTDHEDAMLGKQRDALMNQARQALEEELAHLRQAATSAIEGAQDEPSPYQIPS
ncbi:hypothetical protein ACG74X_11630 [Marivita sp. S0852]|uniref:hypothetical protein n=1 Tax=Marivita sp. S0852 TaxID=3373893 RepID=UPI003982A571